MAQLPRNHWHGITGIGGTMTSGLSKMRVDRLSRHLYDVYHLSRAGVVEKAINDKELYEIIVAHRYKFSRVSEVDYNLHNPKTLNPTPPENKCRYLLPIIEQHSYTIFKTDSTITEEWQTVLEELMLRYEAESKFKNQN